MVSVLQILLLAQHVSGTTMPFIRSSRPANRTQNPQLYTRPTPWKPKHQIPQAATTCIILLSSWWWAYWCPKHVEQAIRSAIQKQSVACSWHFISTHHQYFQSRLVYHSLMMDHPMWSETCWSSFECVSFRLLHHADFNVYGCVSWVHQLVHKPDGQ